MSQAQSVFEAMMRGNGFNDLKKNDKGAYTNSSIQTRWRYFLIGWEMRGAACLNK